MWQYETISIELNDTDDSARVFHAFLNEQSENGWQLEQIVPFTWVVKGQRNEVTKYLVIFKCAADENTNRAKKGAE